VNAISHVKIFTLNGKLLALMQLTQVSTMHSARQYWALTKPRVVGLIVFCAIIGMLLALPDLPPWRLMIAGTLGIWLVSGAAAAVNCLVERHIDEKMARTRGRPLPSGTISPIQTLVFSGVVGGLGLWILYAFVNPLTMWLTLGTFVGYAIVYTVILKPLTPQNIVIGGISGAMPPLLGWTAVTGEVAPEPLLLVLIIFAWTPPHFWSLALYRTEEYAKAGLPMLPVTHGNEFTRLNVLLYTVILVAASLLPYVHGMSGPIYAVGALVLGGIFLYYAIRLYVNYSDALSKSTFRYSIVYLSALFAALLIDHYVF
jgi:heme o synthase